MKTDGGPRERRLMIFAVAVAFRVGAMARQDFVDDTAVIAAARTFLAKCEDAGLLKFGPEDA